MFTLNNPQPEEDPNSWGGHYCVWQLERGEEGTPHYQGYIVFKTHKRLTSMKAINPRAHWELRFGTHEQAHAYCTKEETRVDGPWTYGEPPSQGKRTDLIGLKRRLDAGATFSELADDEEMFVTLSQYPKAFGIYQLAKAKPRDEKPHVLVLWGVAGRGKSYYWKRNYPDAYVKPTGHWWDGYEQQETVVIDDFQGTLLFTLLLHLLDRYPLLVEVKGGTRVFNSKTIIITSNDPPSGWYKDLSEQKYAALERRLDTIYEFTHDPYLILHKGDPIPFNWMGWASLPPPPKRAFRAVDLDPDQPVIRAPSEVVFDDDVVEYHDYQDGERILRPNYRPNPAAPAGVSRDAKRYRDK